MSSSFISYLLIYNFIKFLKTEHYLLENIDWKYDKIPEIMNGKNIADFVDKDILNKLEEIEKEEQML